MLVGIHGGLAMISGRMEWALDTESRAFEGKTEAEFLARSIKDVADFYGGGLLDDKTLAWLNLTQCLAMVYGGRLITIRMTPRAKPQRQPSAAEAAATHNPAQHRSVLATPMPANEFTPQRPTMNGHDDVPPNAGHVAGIGNIEFPADHPLNPKRSH